MWRQRTGKLVIYPPLVVPGSCQMGAVRASSQVPVVRVSSQIPGAVGFVCLSWPDERLVGGQLDYRQWPENGIEDTWG